MTFRSLTRDLAGFIAGSSSSTIPQRALDTALTGMLDTIGVMMAGRDEPAPNILSSTIELGSPESHIAFSSLKANAPHAAWIGATAAHVLDFDDVAIHGHPSAILTPSLLAEGEALQSSGKKLLEAYVVGYETWAELVSREPDHIHGKGWHPTGLFGVIGAAAACAYLRGLDVTQAAHALGLAASQSSGLMLNFGSMAKALVAGNAAANGVMSARLAHKGMTAAEDVIGQSIGLLRAISPAGRVDIDRPVTAGAQWRILDQGLSIKKYPTCLSTHRLIDGIIELNTRHDLRVNDITRIEILMSERNAQILHIHQPRNGLEAKFSAEFAAAAALLAKRVTLAELTDAFVQDARTRDIFPRVHVMTEERGNSHTGYASYDEIRLMMKSGQTHIIRVSDARGGPANPLGAQELFDKFSSCLKVACPQADAESFYADLSNLQNIPNIADFMTRTVAQIHTAKGK